MQAQLTLPGRESSTVGELVNNTLGNVTQDAVQNGMSGNLLQNAVASAVTDEALNAVQSVLDNVTGPAEIEAAAEQISSLLNISASDAADLVQNAIDGNLIGGSLETALNNVLAETLGAGIDELLGGRGSAELMAIVSGLLGGLDGASLTPAALLSALNGLGIPLSSLGLTQEHLNALLGLSVPLCPAAVDVGLPFPAGCLASAWTPAINEICNANWGVIDHGSNSAGNRLSCTNAPDGTPAMAFTDVVGEFASLMDYRQVVDGLAADAARQVTRVFIPEGYEFDSNGRMAMGLRIGDPANPGNQMGGGTNASDQDASSVRVNFRMDGDSIAPAIYGYYLNRNASTSSGDGTQQWGQNTHTDAPLPKGQWVTMVLDVVLNDVGQANGSTALTILDEAGNTISSATETGVVLRNDPSWKIIGPYMTEKLNEYGEYDRNQSIYYSDYSISAATGTGEECAASAATDDTATEGVTPVSTGTGPT